ncbi:hypothetical protein B0O80DRAFT_234373 [Mortierella sp. GBAus27b]|nr:hypothetical protein B0O80DRAFT_234373 [Mortierella sp. GBAus27b]
MGQELVQPMDDASAPLDGRGGLSVGAITGIAVGLILAFLVGALLFIRKRRQGQKKRMSPEQEGESNWRPTTLDDKDTKSNDMIKTPRAPALVTNNPHGPPIMARGPQATVAGVDFLEPKTTARCPQGIEVSPAAPPDYCE